MTTGHKTTTGALLLAASLAFPAAAERTLEQMLPAAGVDAVVLRGGNGSVHLVAGDLEEVRVRVAIRPEGLSDREPLRGIKKWFLSSAYEDVNDLIEAIQLDFDQSGTGTLAVGLKPPRRTRESRVTEDWKIIVPRRLAVSIAMARADMEVTGIAGGVDISLGNGVAEVEVPGGDLDIDVTVGKAKVVTGSDGVDHLSLRSQVGDTELWMNGLQLSYPDPPGPGSQISMSGTGTDSIKIAVQVGDASLRVDETLRH